MATDIDALEKRYLDSCKRQGVLPNKAILSSLFQAKTKRARHEASSLVILLDDLKDVDFEPLHALLLEVNASDIDVVDIVNRCSCALSGEHVLSLLRSITEKLRVVDLQDISFGKDFLLDLAQRGLTCCVLNLRSSHFRKLNMVGNFMQLHSLNLDFSVSLTSFREDCFTCMPNLKFLSMCETRVTNLWTTTAALAKLPSLVELRFQHCLRSDNTWVCPALSCKKEREDVGPHAEALSLYGEDILFPYDIEEEDMDTYDMNYDLGNTQSDSSDDSEVDFSNHNPDFSLANVLPNVASGWSELVDLQSEISFRTWELQGEDELFPNSSNSGCMSGFSPKKYTSHHASPICYEKYYREFLIVSLPNLNILDNLPIEKIDRERANLIYSHFFEYLPYRRKSKVSVVSILQNREIRAEPDCIRTPRRKSSNIFRRSQHCYSRSLSAGKVGSSAWPILHPLSITGSMSRDERRSFRPRQFEYHPSDASLMVFGTLDGEVVVINHESEKIVSYIPSLGAMNSILGLCWLKTYPSKLIAGSDNGSLRLYDINQTTVTSGLYHNANSVNFDEFDQLTSVHVNSTDELFLASGYSKHVALYDISTGRRLQVFADMHREHINVVKFSNHSSSIFATSSFDQDIKLWDLRQKLNQPCYTSSSSRGNVMVCFSPDDHYLLVSAIDNEVKQLLAVDGRLHVDFGIASTGSSQNYTRSYYMNGRDYVISGSCDENVVRICCAQTGRRLRDVSLEGKGSGASMFVQSLRGDPFRDFNMSILAAYIRPSSNSEIVKVNLLASSDSDKVSSDSRHSHASNSMGG